MADPRQPTGNTSSNKKTPVASPQESATKPAPQAGQRDLIPQRTSIINHLVSDEQLQQWMKQVNEGEGAARMRQDDIATGFMNEDVLDAIAADMGMEKVILNQVNITPELIAEVPVAIAKKYGVVPVRSNEHEIWLALSDPHNVQALDDLSRLLNKRVHGMVAMEDDIERAMKRFYEGEDYHSLYDVLTESDDPGYNKKWDELDLTGEGEETNQPRVVKFVDLIFRRAVHERASDIHIEPSKRGLTIRFRIDGVLHEVPSPPAKWQNSIISRIKVLSSMDLAEKRVPLDGRIRLSMPDKKLDLRVSTLPTIFGESIVMRLLDQSSVMMGLADVGFLPSSTKIFNELIRTPNGVILMTGPTGSG